MLYRIAKDSSKLNSVMKSLLHTGLEGDLLMIEGNNQEDILYLRITSDKKWEVFIPEWDE